MAVEKVPTTGAPARIKEDAHPLIFKLDPKEQAFIEAQEEAREKRLAEAGIGDASATGAYIRKRTALVDALVKEYPPTEGANGLLYWSHEDIGEVGYIIIANSLGHFDPRSMARDYRPPLDVPNYGEVKAVGFKP